MIDLEQKVIGYMLMNPEALKVNEFESRWFDVKEYRRTAEGLQQTNGEFNDFSELVYQIKENDPFTDITADWLDAEKYNSYNVADIASSIKTLKKTYLKRRIQEASKAYADKPTEQNRTALENRLSELNDYKEDTDNGDITDATEDMEWQLNNEKEDGIKTFKDLDAILGDGLEGGRMVVVGARPGTGKTAWGINVALLATERQEKIAVDFYSLEMTKIHMLKRFISKMAGINSYKLKNPKLNCSNEEKQRIIEQNNKLKETNIRMFDKCFSIDDIERQINRRHSERTGEPYLVLIDYLQLIKPSKAGQSRQVEIGQVTRTLKMLANRLNLTIVLFSQLSRAAEDGGKPTLRHLRESGDIEQDADIVGLMHEDEEETGKIYFEVAKNRDGRDGTLTYTFHKSTMYFEEFKEWN